MNCNECGSPAIGVVFTRGNPADIPVCKKCSNTKYKGWDSQSLNTAGTATGLFIRNHLKGISTMTAKPCDYRNSTTDPAIRVCATHAPETGLYGDEQCAKAKTRLVGYRCDEHGATGLTAPCGLPHQPYAGFPYASLER